MFNISLRPALVGNGTSTCTSSLPGRSSASSSSSFRFVMPINRTLGSVLTPSNFDKSWLTTEFLVMEPESSVSIRFLNTASISSITSTCRPLCKIASPSPSLPAAIRHIDISCSASRNNSRTKRSLPPTHLSNSSGAATILGVLAPNALAISRTRSVFPTPGFPYKSSPLTGCNPSKASSSASSLDFCIALLSLFPSVLE
mmetsp:Transcript_9720/g.21630  ORF Transcript_9720/g.21630 Transcript_9720/m.21630 type:complete len:200 (-) Transcript_9720:867-1466(-)